MAELFPSIAFQSTLTIEAVLFGVFGFLYSVYAMFSSAATPDQPVRAPICNALTKLCRWMAGLITLNSVLAIYSLIILGPAGGHAFLLSIGIVISVLSMAGISLWMAFLAME